jgi:hypothetical protein
MQHEELLRHQLDSFKYLARLAPRPER